MIAATQGNPANQGATMGKPDREALRRQLFDAAMAGGPQPQTQSRDDVQELLDRARMFLAEPRVPGAAAAPALAVPPPRPLLQPRNVVRQFYAPQMIKRPRNVGVPTRAHDPWRGAPQAVLAHSGGSGSGSGSSGGSRRQQRASRRRAR